MSKKYTEEFKKDAVAMAREICVTSACQKLSIPQKTMYTWMRSERLNVGTGLKGCLPGETPEQALKRLEKENAELRQANEILRKAMGFLAGR